MRSLRGEEQARLRAELKTLSDEVKEKEARLKDVEEQIEAALLAVPNLPHASVPVYTPPSGADPIVRQDLSDHPEWVDGLAFASGRMTAERGPGPFLAFQSAYEKAFGPDEVGVKTAEGKAVIQPPEFPMYSYDFVNVLAAALTAAHSTDGSKVVAALNEVDTRGANGDERGFNEKNHDGVVDDDVYFAVFHDMTYSPVKDDPLSATLPTISQTR